MRLSRADILGLIPHQHGMCLLDGVLTWDDERIECTADSHRASDNPLRRDGWLDPIHLAEYGAQAMAVHGGLIERRRGASPVRPGFLAALRDLRIERIDLASIDASLHVTAIRLGDLGAGKLYVFEITAEGRPLASGRTTVMHLETP